MSDFIITEHAIIPSKYIAGVTTVRTTPEYYDLEKTVPASEERYSIVGHSPSGEKIPLYVDLKHEEIPSKMKIVAGQLSKKTTPIPFSPSAKSLTTTN